MMVRGIDVSHHQGMIDWQKVKAAGVQFAMIRAGFGWDNDSQIDKQLHNNVDGAQAAGIPYGLFHYSYAQTPEDAQKEARWFLRVIGGMKPSYPVAFDFEEPEQLALSPDKQLAVIDAFMQTVEAAGYYSTLYMSASPMERLYGCAPDRLDRYDRWVAHVGVKSPAFSGSFGIWQYDWKGRVNGIGGDVDLDYAYKDYPALIRAAGLNGWGAQPDGNGKPPDYEALYRSEQQMRIAAEADRDEHKAARRTAEQERDALLAKLAQVRNIVL